MRIIHSSKGFYLEDPDHKRRRYCLICHIFKPERCHHCSACNRCVLNMDHHCPWLNNCIGFYNRKFFLLTLFYALVLKALVVVGFFYRFIQLAVIIEVYSSISRVLTSNSLAKWLECTDIPSICDRSCVCVEWSDDCGVGSFLLVPYRSFKKKYDDDRASRTEERSNRNR